MKAITLCGSFLISLGLTGQVYRASDDGRVVYFSGRPATLSPVDRLWAWEGGRIRTVTDGWRLEALRRDGVWALVQGETGWRLLRNEAAAVELGQSAAGLMSANGRWVVMAPRFSEAQGLRRISNDGRVEELGAPSLELAGGAGRMVLDDGTVVFPCGNGRACVWWGAAGSVIYYWDSMGIEPGAQKLMRLGRGAGEATATGVECVKVLRQTFAPSGRLDFAWYEATGGVEAVGTKVLYRCGPMVGVFDPATGTTAVAGVGAVVDSGMTKVLTRPAAERFAWAPLGTATGALDGYDSIGLFGPLNGFGLLSYAGEPDFTLTWGGQEMPWMQGAHGYAYAAVPRDVVEGVVDSVAVTSATRPWLNMTAQVRVQEQEAVPVPLVAADPGILFIHGDYRGFVQPGSLPQRGDYLHFPVSGIGPGASTGPLVASYSFPVVPSAALRPPLQIALPVVALTPVEYPRSMTVMTVRIPEGAAVIPGDTRGPSFTMEVTAADGRRSTVRVSGFLRF